MSKVMVNCVGCGVEIHKSLCKKVYRGQKNYGFVCPHCEEEAKHKAMKRIATNTASDKATSSYYTLELSVKNPTADITAWLESLGYAPKYDNFGNAKFIGNEVQGFQSITKLVNSYEKRFDNPKSMVVKCRDLRGNELNLKTLDGLRLFSKYKGYEKCVNAIESGEKI